MELTKNQTITKVLNVIIYVSIISILSIKNYITDVMFFVGFMTIIISTFLFLLKINLDKFKLFIWINLFFFCLYIFTLFM